VSLLVVLEALVAFDFVLVFLLLLVAVVPVILVVAVVAFSFVLLVSLALGALLSFFFVLNSVDGRTLSILMKFTLKLMSLISDVKYDSKSMNMFFFEECCP